MQGHKERGAQTVSRHPIESSWRRSKQKGANVWRVSSNEREEKEKDESLLGLFTHYDPFFKDCFLLHHWPMDARSKSLVLLLLYSEFDGNPKVWFFFSLFCVYFLFPFFFFSKPPFLSFLLSSFFFSSFSISPVPPQPKTPRPSSVFKTSYPRIHLATAHKKNSTKQQPTSPINITKYTEKPCRPHWTTKGITMASTTTIPGTATTTTGATTTTPTVTAPIATATMP